MLELLNPQLGERVLDIGSGSGWTSALLGELVGSKGKVYGVEIIPELVEFGKENIKKFDLSNVEILQAKELGLPEQGPFDKILVSASAEELPKELIDQLKMKGVIVLPIKESIWKITKISEDRIEKEEHPGFVFVPLV
jgi:protein-L-isoaspartate(D-aspartate) O-methyltransferase